MEKCLTPELFHGYYTELLESRDVRACQFYGYPPDYQRIDQKSLPVISRLGLLNGACVLEVGSNFGMYSLLMSGFTKYVYALEIDKCVFEVGLAWRKFFEARGFKFPNLEQINCPSKKASDLEYDALLLCLVLYHLDNDEIECLLEDAKSKCEKVVVQCRPSRVIKSQKGALPGHVSKTTLFDGLCDIAGNIRFLQAMGMKNIAVHVSEKLLGEEVFPVICGYR